MDRQLTDKKKKMIWHERCSPINQVAGFAKTGRHRPWFILPGVCHVRFLSSPRPGCRRSTHRHHFRGAGLCGKPGHARTRVSHFAYCRIIQLPVGAAIRTPPHPHSLSDQLDLPGTCRFIRGMGKRSVTHPFLTEIPSSAGGNAASPPMRGITSKICRSS